MFPNCLDLDTNKRIGNTTQSEQMGMQTDEQQEKQWVVFLFLRAGMSSTAVLIDAMRLNQHNKQLDLYSSSE